MIEQVGNLTFVNGVFGRYAGAADGKPVLRTVRLDKVDTPHGQALVFVHDEHYQGETPTVVRGFNAGTAGQYWRAGYQELVTIIKRSPGTIEQRRYVAGMLIERGYRGPVDIKRIY